MQLPLVVGIQQRFGDNIEFLSEEKSRLVAEGKAEWEYIERQAYMAVVIEIDKNLVVNTEKVTEVFKITRTCKCLRQQRIFNYKLGTSRLVCEDCKIRFGKEETINEPVQDTRTTQDDEILSDDETEDISSETVAQEASHTSVS